MALSSLSNLWTFARKVEDLFSLHQEVKASLQVIEERLRGLEDRVLALESGQGQMLTEARNAAVFMASGVITEAVTRLTRLESRTELLEQGRMPPS